MVQNSFCSDGFSSHVDDESNDSDDDGDDSNDNDDHNNNPSGYQDRRTLEA